MEQGNLRCDVNVSLAPIGSLEWGTRTETKNVNSLRSVERAVRYEMRRQAAVLDDGRPDRAGDPALPRGHRQHLVRAGARRRRPTTGTSPSPTWCRSPRTRSGSRSSPPRCPSCPPPAAPACRRSGASRRRDGLAGQRRRRRPGRATPSRPAPRRPTPASGGSASWPGGPTTPASSWPSSRSRRRRWPSWSGWSAAGTINDQLARQALDGVLAGEGDPAQVVEARGLAVMGESDELVAAVDAAIEGNPDVAEKVRGGKVQAIGALVGAVMKTTRGKADAATVKRMLEEQLRRSTVLRTDGGPERSAR